MRDQTSASWWVGSDRVTLGRIAAEKFTARVTPIPPDVPVRRISAAEYEIELAKRIVAARDTFVRPWRRWSGPAEQAFEVEGGDLA